MQLETSIVDSSIFALKLHYFYPLLPKTILELRNEPTTGCLTLHESTLSVKKKTRIYFSTNGKKIEYAKTSLVSALVRNSIQGQVTVILEEENL